MVPLATGATNGILVSGAGAVVVVENCNISSMPQAAIRLNSSARMHVLATVMRGNGFGAWISGGTATIARSTIVESAQYGVLVSGGGGTTIQVDITASVLDGNLYGVHAASNIDASVVKVSVHGSQLARNSIGISAATSIGSTSMAASGNNISNNSNAGVYVNGTASRMWLAGNLVTGNGIYGLRQEGGGTLESAGNNNVRQNPFNTVGTIMKVAGE